MTALPAREAYEHIADGYDGAPNPMLSLEARVVAPLLPRLERLRVADIAAGTGRWAAHCRAEGALTVAIDFAWKMLMRAPGDRVLADAARLPLRDASVDLAICAFGLGYAPGCPGELARITRRGGMVIASDVHPERLRSGWRRGFRVGGETVEAVSTAYELADLGAPGLALTALHEAAFGEPERAIFAQAGKAASFADAASVPAIFVAQWIKR